MKTNDTLFGGRPVKVRLLDGTQAEFKVRQLTVGEYEKAFALIDDEIALTALICGHDKAWANNLQPDSYEQLYATAQEVNGSFFAWSARRREREQAANRENIAAMAALPPEALKVMQETALKSLSPIGSPAPRPR